MDRNPSVDLGDVVTRRDYLFGAGSIAVLGGTAGCLGLGGDDQQPEESESETSANDSADENADDAPEEPADEDAADDDNDDEEQDGEEEDDAAETESEDEATVEEGVDNEDVDAEDDNSTLEEESEDNESDDRSEDQVGEDDRGEDETNVDEEGEGDDGQANDGEGEEEDDETGDERTDGVDENSDEDDEEQEDDEESDEEEDGDEIGEERDSSAARYTNDEYGYELEYPAEWVVEEGDDYVQIVDGDEIARIWVEFAETGLDLDQGVRNYRETFDPNPGVEVHEDDPMTLSSGEEGHRFVIEITDTERNQIFAHELIAHANGIQYLTSVIISRSEYNEDYAQLAEEILASVALS